MLVRIPELCCISYILPQLVSAVNERYHIRDDSIHHTCTYLSKDSESLRLLNRSIEESRAKCFPPRGGETLLTGRLVAPDPASVTVKRPRFEHTRMSYALIIDDPIYMEQQSS